MTRNAIGILFFIFIFIPLAFMVIISWNEYDYQEYSSEESPAFINKLVASFGGKVEKVRIIDRFRYKEYLIIGNIPNKDDLRDFSVKNNIKLFTNPQKSIPTIFNGGNDFWHANEITSKEVLQWSSDYWLVYGQTDEGEDVTLGFNPKSDFFFATLHVKNK